MAKKKQKNRRRYKRHSRKAAAVTQQLGTSNTAPATRPRTYGPCAYGMELEARRRREGRDPVSGRLVTPTLFDEVELSPAGAMRERPVPCIVCGRDTFNFSCRCDTHR